MTLSEVLLLLTFVSSVAYGVFDITWKISHDDKKYKNKMWLSLLVSHPKVLKMGQHIVQNKGMTPKREKMRHVKETEDAPE